MPKVRQMMITGQTRLNLKEEKIWLVLNRNYWFENKLSIFVTKTLPETTSSLVYFPYLLLKFLGKTGREDVTNIMTSNNHALY